MNCGWGLYPLPALSLPTSQTSEIVNGVPSQLEGCLLDSVFDKSDRGGHAADLCGASLQGLHESH